MQEAPIALNPARVGHRYPSYTYEVSREKVREYALATGVTDPCYLADPSELPPEQVIAPPTFAACFTVSRGLRLLFEDAELGAHPRLVHGGQEYVFQRPVRVGDVLRCTPQIVDLSSRSRMELLTLQVACVEATSGEGVVTSRGTLIFFSGEDDERAAP